MEMVESPSLEVYRKCGQVALRAMVSQAWLWWVDGSTWWSWRSFPISVILGLFNSVILHPGFPAGFSWAGLGWLMISSSLSGSCCGWLDRRRLCHWSSSSCSGQYSMGSSMNGCMAAWIQWPKRARMGSSMLSKEEFKCVQHICCTNRAKMQMMLSVLFTTVQMLLDSISV